MHPPSFMCKQIFRLHPQLRLAWCGRERQHEDELNAGSFAVVQLYHIQDCGTYELPTTYREFWEVTGRLNLNGGLEMVPIHRGPIYNRWGGAPRDWDPLFRKPIFVCEIDDIRAVYDGTIMDELAQGLRPIVKRAQDSAKAKGKQIADKAEDIGREAGDYWWHEASKTGETGVMMTKEDAENDLTDEFKKHRTGELRQELEDVYAVPGV